MLSKAFLACYLSSGWWWAGVLLHIAATCGVIRLLADFKFLFDLAWENGPDGPTPLYDAFLVAIASGILGGCACYVVAWVDTKRKFAPQLRDTNQ